MSNILTIACFFVLIARLSAQDFQVLSGQIVDAKTQEPIPFANIWLDKLQKGVSSDIEGMYHLELVKGEYSVQYSYVGYATIEQLIKIDTSHQVLNIQLELLSNEVDEIVVEAKDDLSKEASSIGTSFSAAEIKNLPSLMGEKDMLKIATLTNGISMANDGGTGLFIRGGNSDQNLVLFDEATVYSPSHALGFFSIFNTDIVSLMSFWYSGLPSQYGGRASAILQVDPKRGESDQFGFSGSLGLITAKLAINIPLPKKKGALLISGRRSYLDLYLKMLKDEELRNNEVYFYDLTLAGYYQPSSKDVLKISGYYGRDRVLFFENFGIDWGNLAATLQWNHLFNDQFLSKTMLTYSNFDYKIERFNKSNTRIAAGLQEGQFKQEFHYQIAPDKYELKFGGGVLFRRFEPGKLIKNSDTNPGFTIAAKQALESNVFVSSRMQIQPKFNLRIGLRYNLFNALGPTDYYTFDEYLEVEDTIAYKAGKVYQTYHGLAPRVGLWYQPTEEHNVYGMYSRLYQYVHLVSSATVGLPTDLWLPSSQSVRPQITDEWSLGYKFMSDKWGLELKTELYFKLLQNQVDYKNGANIFLNPYIESQLVYGKGRVYGVDFLLKKAQGKFTGWLAYTLAKTERSFPKIYEGKWFPATQDRTHDLSIVLQYKIHPRWTIATTWTYRTGDAVTYPSGSYKIDGHRVLLFSERNGHRIPDYHRWDIGLTYDFKLKKRFQSDFNLSIYNVYARRNTFMVLFEENKNNPNQFDAVRYSLTTIIPSLTWNFKF
ncbi:MAG: TonB-dependent receptor [Aureispira sp.]|nr:TonB-dependent receptor [Aureispira sp.]